jgi:hypothetical protein
MHASQSAKALRTSTIVVPSPENSKCQETFIELSFPLPTHLPPPLQQHSSVVGCFCIRQPYFAVLTVVGIQLKWGFVNSMAAPACIRKVGAVLLCVPRKDHGGACKFNPFFRNESNSGLADRSYQLAS